MSESVWVKGTRLRAGRQAAGLTLFDVSRDIMSPANLSRIERHERYRLALDVLISLGRRLGLALEETTRPQAWAEAVVNSAIDRMKQWRFSEAITALQMRDAVMGPVAPLTETRAQILGEWARLRCGDPDRPDVVGRLALQARDTGASREAVWAEVLLAKMHDHPGSRERALAIFPIAADHADHAREPLDILCTRAAWARLLVREGRLPQALAALQHASKIAESARGYGEARFLHAWGLVHMASGNPEEAERALQRAAAAASALANYRMAGTVERDLARVYELRGDTDKADAALIRAASFFTRAGDSHDAAEMISGALGHHIAPSPRDHPLVLTDGGGGQRTGARPGSG